MRTALLILFSFASIASATIIDTNRVIDWSLTGIPGGIPNSSNMTTFVTVTSGNMTASYLQGRIDACPSNQVIQLPAGTFAINGTLNFGLNHGVVLRGAGMGVTKLTGIHIYMGQAGGTPVAPSISSGATKGSSSIVVSSATSFRVGDYMTIEGGDDPDIVILPGTEDSGPGQPSQKFIGVITNISGTTISFYPPLPYKHLTSGAYNGQALKANIYNNLGATPNFLTRAGVENMSLTLDSGWDYGVDLHSVAYCWFKGVEISHSGQRMLYIQRGFACEVFHCYIHDSTYQGPLGYGVTLEPAFSCRIVNNLASNLSGTFQVNEGSSGNVFAYNYSVMTTSDFDNNIPDFQDHTGTPVMNLFEGNWGYMAFFDDIHGSSAYHTVFRNRLTGYQPPHGPGNAWGTHQNFALAAAVNTKYCNFVANVLGDVPGATTNITTYIRTNQNYSVLTPAIIALDADAGGIYANTTNAAQTAFIHANWDSVGRAIRWDAWNSTNSDKTIPDSYYLTTKPDWWGNIAWPPYNPSNTTAATMSPTNLPIGYFAVYGVDPPSSTNPPVIYPVDAHGTNGQTFAYQATSDTATSWGASNLNSGLTISSLGAISGTPTITATNVVTLLATNSYGGSSTNINIGIEASDTNPSTITSTLTASGTTNVAFSYTITGTHSPTGYTAVNLPTGLSVNATNGVISGTPTVAVTTNSTITASNAFGGDSQTLVITIGVVYPLVLQLGFDENTGTNVTDSSNYGNNGYFQGTVNWTNGYFGSGVLIGTSNSLVRIPYAESLDSMSNGITLECWVYPMTDHASTPAWSTLFFHGDEDNNNVEYILNGSTTTSGRPSFWVRDTGFFGTTALPLNTWTHIAATYNETNAIIYTNAVQMSSTAKTGDMARNYAWDTTIGGNDFYVLESWGGIIDEVRIYNRALSASEVQVDMTNRINAASGGGGATVRVGNLQIYHP